MQPPAELRYSVRSDWLRAQDGGKEFMEKFVQLRFDEGTQRFLTTYCGERDSWKEVLRDAARSALKIFVANTTANGLLRAGQMHVLSTEQAGILLEDRLAARKNGGHLLDVGAGDGTVTNELRPLFESVSCTEVNPVLVRSLRQHGFRVWHSDTVSTHAMGADLKFDVISALNIFDRCDEPITLLDTMVQHLHPVTGLLLVSIVIPVHASVEGSLGRWREPQEFAVFYQHNRTAAFKVPA